MQDSIKKDLSKRQTLKGQSLIEMALLLPLLVVLIMGAIELGRLFYTKIVVTNAAREGAYYLATHPSDYDPISGSAPNTTRAAEAEASNSGISDISVEITPIDCCDMGGRIKVTVETNVEDLFLISLISGLTTLSATNYEEFPISSSVEMMIQ